ncbi:hypothetical protein AWU65_13200 [Paenibacillus glucanolyticus]|uniref:SWIM-type domain-containing protein n=1 Tax=Paenibacillus glucanolyticus TaxID=59843 RepID=A0A163JU81_9BACL|nr:hypothetical protein [Paenibacillus glucanolyticus]KZS46809.1 hypothetical protein AWU65_13200 [Paenibacillus glucanolyticus]
MEPIGASEPMELVFEPGLLKGKVKRAEESPDDCEVSVHVKMLDAAAREAVLAYLQEDPQALYRLLAGKGAPWLDELAPSPLPGAALAAAADCTCGQSACGHAAALLAAAASHIAAEPLQQLTLLGLPREALLAGVFAAWAKAAPPAGGSAADTATRAKEKGPSGPSPGEWVAEAAAEGRLHRPGPQLGELAVQLSPPPPADQLGPVGDWTSLLPGVRGASKALGLIARGAAKQAEQKRRSLRLP